MARAASGATLHASSRAFFLTVAGLALAVRLVHLASFSTATPFFDPAPWNTPASPMEPGRVDLWGMQIVHGDPWWTDHGSPFHSPVYPYFVAGIYWIMGGRSVFGVARVQALLGALTCALIGLLARRLISPTWGWVAALAAAFYAPSIFYGSFLLREPLATFLATAALFVSLNTFGPRLEERKEARWLAWIGTGVVWGAAVAAWPLVALVAGVTAAWAGWRVRRHIECSWRAALVASGLLVCGMGLAIVPCTLRNVVGEGRFVLISDAGSEGWALGNSMGSNGTRVEHPGVRRSPATRGFWILYAQKIRLFLEARELPDATDYELLKEDSPVLAGPLPAFGFAVPFALVGLLASRGRWREWLPLHAMGVLYPLNVAAFFVVGRHRLVWMPALIFFGVVAAATLRNGTTLLKGAGTWAVRSRVAVAILFLGWMANPDRPVTQDVAPFQAAFARYHADRGDAAISNGRAREALDAFHQVLRVPARRYQGLGHTGLAGVYLGLLNRPDLALQEMRRSLEADPDQPEAERAREVIRRLEARVKQAPPS